MAGFWIKMRTNLRDDPKVLRIAANLKKDRRFVIGCLFELWAMADEHSRDGSLQGLTPKILDKQVGIVGFSQQLVAIGWIVFNEQGASVPRFEEHNGQSAKRRAEESARKARARTQGTVSRDARRDGSSLTMD
jgi:hypothetical protein